MTVTNQLAMEHGIFESQRLDRTPAIESAPICEHHALRQTVPELPGLRTLDEQSDRRGTQDEPNRAGRRSEAYRSAVIASREARRQGRSRAAPSTLQGSTFGAQRTRGRIDCVRAPWRAFQYRARGPRTSEELRRSCQLHQLARASVRGRAERMAQSAESRFSRTDRVPSVSNAEK
jgi:hypothetical protein